MKFDKDKKDAIVQYLIEKIYQQCENPVRNVAEALEVNPATVYNYLNSLINKGIVEKERRGKYKLIQSHYVYDLERSNGDFKSDTYAFCKYFEKHIEGFPDNVRSIWNYTFTEMMNNIIEHSEADHARIKVVQNHYATTVVLDDDGIGIFNKIKTHFDLDSLDDAIGELFKGKITTDSLNHSGEGIFFSSKLMDTFIIMSSQKIFATNKYNDTSIVDIAGNTLNGTCVIMGISNYSRKTSKEVFDRFSNNEGEFYKTSIPLKNIFETSPISRSQAKRLCDHLDAFGEIVLDFQDVEWMGQGFAHQIFVVFARNHPDITITPVNMNNDVTRMRHHVLTGI